MGVGWDPGSSQGPRPPGSIFIFEVLGGDGSLSSIILCGFSGMTGFLLLLFFVLTFFRKFPLIGGQNTQEGENKMEVT